MAKDYIFGFNPTKVPESFERPDHIPEFIHGPRPNIVPSQDNKVISYYEEIIRLKRAMDALQGELEAIIRTQIPDYDSTNANNVLSVNEDGTQMEWKPATSASGISASVEQTETGATITITDSSGTTTANIENGEPGEPGFSPSAKVEQTATGATITVTDKSGTTSANIDNGGKGDPGDPGFSPSARVQQTETGATITVTDETGTTTAELKNGKDGVGIPGNDGFSPIANVQQTETGATITVTDKSGTTTADLTNGAPGATGQTPSVSATATVNDSQGIPSVEVTKTGTDEAPAFNFAFSGLKGETGEGTKGDDGFSPIANVQQTEAGATITVTDKSGTTSASVKNGTDGVTPNVSATATVDNTTGTPSVQVTKSGTAEAPAFNFDFSGIKGETGKGTKGDDGFSPIANVQQTEAGATITVTDKSGTTSASVKNGTDGTKGDPGVTPSIAVTASVDNTTGTPSVDVTKTGTDEAPAFNFAFSGLKGESASQEGNVVTWVNGIGSIYPAAKSAPLQTRYGRTNNKKVTYTVSDLASGSSYTVKVQFDWDFSPATAIGERTSYYMDAKLNTGNVDTFLANNPLEIKAKVLSVSDSSVTATIDNIEVVMALNDMTYSFDIVLSTGTSNRETQTFNYSNDFYTDLVFGSVTVKNLGIAQK